MSASPRLATSARAIPSSASRRFPAHSTAVRREEALPVFSLLRCGKRRSPASTLPLSVRGGPLRTLTLPRRTLCGGGAYAPAAPGGCASSARGSGAQPRSLSCRFHEIPASRLSLHALTVENQKSLASVFKRRGFSHFIGVVEDRNRQIYILTL